MITNPKNRVYHLALTKGEVEAVRHCLCTFKLAGNHIPRLAAINRVLNMLHEQERLVAGQTTTGALHYRNTATLTGDNNGN